MKHKGCRNKIKGKVKSNYGYIHIFEPLHPAAMKNGYILEHRMMAYDAGMLTDLSNEVHHINEIKTDNRLENFKVLSKSEHRSITWKGRIRTESGLPCKFCPTKTRSKYGLCRKHYKL